ncbi:MAG TPA: cardiolipin synthase [Bacteroidales bacterium]|nr:cardiolipin synthase [Bacteroidales bacterium]HPS73461.1 cardiolipin synthase [Bacteroidales bacterium]
MPWITIAEIVYILIVALVCLRIIYDTRSSSKTLAYLLLAIFVPVAGMLFYFIFGVNYRKRMIYSKKLIEDEGRLKELSIDPFTMSENSLRKNASDIGNARSLVSLLMNDTQSPLTDGNAVKLLINGEEKFPEVISALEQAQRYIHLEYYIYDDDEIGNRIKDILIRKAKEGVEVRMIYDDFGSRSIRKTLAKELRTRGVEAYPFNRVRLLLFANRLNYRNHRKLIIIDGQCGFVGGINIADRYINSSQDKDHKYWRDTHLRIDGPGILFLQHMFLCDWNFCSGHKIQPVHKYFCAEPVPGSNTSVQIAASGPDSPASTIKLSFLKAINLAQHEILLTTPYLIPGGSIMDALKIATMGGVKVKLIVPGVSDSILVNAAAWSNYGELLKAGVELYTYNRGFIHAKTMVIDGRVSIVGTANMDHRSFDLNFEVNAVIYSAAFAEQLRRSFVADLAESSLITYDQWHSRPFVYRLAERVARLMSPLL